MPPAAQVKMDRKAILVDELTGISVLAPNSPHYTPFEGFQRQIPPPGLPPTVLETALRVGTDCYEAGLTEFVPLVREDGGTLGESSRPYLKRIYGVTALE